jgi:hypothetical protein
MSKEEIELTNRIDNLQIVIEQRETEINILRTRLKQLKREKARLKPQTQKRK